MLPPPVATEAVVWRAAGCEPPLWSLERPVPTSSAWLPPAAAAALRAGTPFSEFFACGTLEPLRHVARQLLAGTRRRGRSVWQSCFRPNSPCLWFCGNHSDGEHFLHQVLSSPAVLLRRMSEFRRALDGTMPTLPPLRLLDAAAGDGAYTQHQPDGMGALPALPLVRDLGWSALLLEPIRSTYAWLESNFDGLSHATLRNYGVTPNATREMATMYALHGSVPELAARWPLVRLAADDAAAAAVRFEHRVRRAAAVHARPLADEPLGRRTRAGGARAGGARRARARIQGVPEGELDRERDRATT